MQKYIILYLYMVILRAFPHNNALFRVGDIMTPASWWFFFNLPSGINWHFVMESIHIPFRNKYHPKCKKWVGFSQPAIGENMTQWSYLGGGLKHFLKIMFTPIPGENDPIWQKKHIFQMGWLTQPPTIVTNYLRQKPLICFGFFLPDQISDLSLTQKTCDSLSLGWLA